jgi:hypothetical protein
MALFGFVAAYGSSALDLLAGLWLLSLDLFFLLPLWEHFVRLFTALAARSPHHRPLFLNLDASTASVAALSQFPFHPRAFSSDPDSSPYVLADHYARPPPQEPVCGKVRLFIHANVERRPRHPLRHA